MNEHIEHHHSSNSRMVFGPHPHVHPVSLYWIVFGALIALTVITVFLAAYDFGKFSMIVTLLIAGTKASLVLAFFMHLWWDSKFFGIILSLCMVFLGLFLLFPIMDFHTRSFVDENRENFMPRDERVYDHHLKNPQSLDLRPGLKEADKSHLIFEGAHH